MLEAMGGDLDSEMLSHPSRLCFSLSTTTPTWALNGDRHVLPRLSVLGLDTENQPEQIPEEAVLGRP